MIKLNQKAMLIAQVRTLNLELSRTGFWPSKHKTRCYILLSQVIEFVFKEEMSPTCLAKISNLENDEFLLENKGYKVDYWCFISDNVRNHTMVTFPSPKPRIE